jgi:hypothetical protein
MRCIIPEWVTHRFVKGDINPIKFHDMMQLGIIQNFIINFRKRETYLTLDLVQDPVYAATSSSSPATPSNNYNSH